MAKSDDYREVFYTPKEKSTRQGFVRKGEKRDPQRPKPRPGEGSMRLAGEPEPRPRSKPPAPMVAPALNPIERIKAVLDEAGQRFTAQEIAESMARTEGRRGFGGSAGAPLFSPAMSGPGVAPTEPNPRVTTPFLSGRRDPVAPAAPWDFGQIGLPPSAPWEGTPEAANEVAAARVAERRRQAEEDADYRMTAEYRNRKLERLRRQGERAADFRMTQEYRDRKAARLQAQADRDAMNAAIAQYEKEAAMERLVGRRR